MRWGEREPTVTPVTRVLIRMAFWMLAVIISIFPALHESHVRPGLHIRAMAIAVNEAGYFRDFFFVVIVATIQSFSTLLDRFFLQFERFDPSWRWVPILLCVYYIYVLFYGASRFSDLAGMNVAIPPGDFTYDFSFIEVVLFVSFVTELVTSFMDDRR